MFNSPDAQTKGETMPIAIRWKCPYCGTEYSTKEKTEECENRHCKLYHTELVYTEEDTIPKKIEMEFISSGENAYPETFVYIRRDLILK
jgi:hypothetical protein